MEATQETQPEQGFIRTTLKERGPQLPLGVIGMDRNVHQTFETRRWRMAEEKVLGERREVTEKQGGNMGKYVSVVLSNMCSMMGSYDWKDMKPETPEREAIISQMWMGDVFYAWCWLRLQALGERLPLRPTSPFTGEAFDMVADLGTVEVDIPKSFESTLWTYKLVEPIPFRGKQIKEFLMGPARWASIERLDNPTLGQAKAAIIAAHIYRLPAFKGDDGEMLELPVLESDLDEMGKRDIEGLADAINDHGFGPIMKVDAVCPKTRRPFEAAIDWKYDSFFGSGSQ